MGGFDGLRPPTEGSGDGLRLRVLPSGEGGLRLMLRSRTLSPTLDLLVTADSAGDMGAAGDEADLVVEPSPLAILLPRPLSFCNSSELGWRLEGFLLPDRMVWPLSVDGSRLGALGCSRLVDCSRSRLPARSRVVDCSRLPDCSRAVDS